VVAAVSFLAMYSGVRFHLLKADDFYFRTSRKTLWINQSTNHIWKVTTQRPVILMYAFNDFFRTTRKMLRLCPVTALAFVFSSAITQFHATVEKKSLNKRRNDHYILSKQVIWWFWSRIILMIQHSQGNKQQKTKTYYNVTLNGFWISESWIFVRKSYHSAHCGHTCCYCSQLCTSYRMLLLLLETITTFICRSITYTTALILLNLSLIRKLKYLTRMNILWLLT
jgi:hypothetical protein